ncbi:MAG: exodeoxyribonuclease VII small subunit [Actinobacteria bacterium]|nr:MAG: exodeoxyribonuclease VII small subunit [Actinomycetota bacterium]
MTEEYAGFASAKARLEEITAQVRDKDTPLEKCLDLLEEGVKIAGRCTELLDHTEWRSAVDEAEGEEGAEAEEGAVASGEAGVTGGTTGDTTGDADDAESDADAPDDPEDVPEPAEEPSEEAEGAPEDARDAE